MADAARELNYTGTFVYQHGDRRRRPPASPTSPTRSGEYEKLETLDGPRREVIRNNTEVLTFFFDTRVLRRERRTTRKTFPALLPEQLAALTQNYELRKGGRERVAGYDAQALILVPRDEFRYGHKLWAELKSGLLLKARMLNENRQIIEQFHFTQVQINAPLTLRSVAAQLPCCRLPPLIRSLLRPPPTPAGPCATSRPASRRSWRCGARSRTAGCRWPTWSTRTDWRRCRCSSSRCPSAPSDRWHLPPGSGYHLH